MKTKILFTVTGLLLIFISANAQSSPIVSGGFSTSVTVSSGNIQSSNREFSNNGCCSANYNYNNQGCNSGNSHHHGHKGKHKHKHKHKHHNCDKHDNYQCNILYHNGHGNQCCRHDD